MPIAKDEALVKRIREKFDYYKNAWSDIYAEGRKDMKYVSGDPWDQKERQLREENNRPCLSTDELNQYLNQLNNSVRQNKRSAKVIPLGSGANDDSAKFIQAMIRGIEYKSNAQSAYQTAFEGASQRGYGFFRIVKQFIPKSCNQELRIKRIPNPDSVLIDPDCKEIACSDAEGCFIVDMIRRDDFKRRFPNAEILDFTPDHVQEASAAWFPDDKHVQVAEFIEVQHQKRILVEFIVGNATQCEYLDEIPDSQIVKNMLAIKGGGTYKITNQREEDTKKIINYFTNGLEILDETEWEGQYIPVIPVFGKELYVDSGSGAKRVLMSLIRLARDPYMLYCYYRSTEAELISMTPKTPFVGAVGQFKTDAEAWGTASKIGHDYLQYDAVTDPTTGAVLPPPERPKYEPQIQPLEIGADAMKRQIQSSIGMYNTSVGRSDTKATSGIAIGKLDEQSSEGTFHFIDNYDTGLTHGYRILNEMIPFVYDTSREVGLMDGEENHSVGQLTIDQDGNIVEHNGEHDVTIDTGPSYQSQRDEVNQFLEALTKMPDQFAKVADLFVKLKNIGPLGDKIAERLVLPQFAQQDGQEPLPPQAQAAIQKGQQENQQLHAWAQKLEGELQQFKQREEAKSLEMQARLEIAKLEAATRIRVAELGAKSKSDATVAQAEAAKELAMLEGAQDSFSQAHDQAHEAGMQAVDNAHDQNMADQTASNQQVLAGQAQAAAAVQAEQQPSQ